MVGRIDHDFSDKWRFMSSYRYYSFTQLVSTQVDVGGLAFRRHARTIQIVCPPAGETLLLGRGSEHSDHPQPEQRFPLQLSA